MRYEEPPIVIIEELINLAQGVSGTQLKPGPFPLKPRLML